jgi:tetratricopeptide (TPR) repeat protein
LSIFAPILRDLFAPSYSICEKYSIYEKRQFFIAAGIALFLLGIPPRSESQQNLDEPLNTARDLSRRGDYARAIPLLQRAIAIDPRNADANSMLGVAYFQSGHPSDAVSPLRLAIAANPQDLAAQGYLGAAEMELRDFSAASEAFEDAVAFSKESEQPLVWWTDFALERYRHLEFALRTSSSGRAELMIVAAEDPNLDAKAKESLLSQAASLDPHSDRVWGELGAAQVELGFRSAAETSLQRALQVGSLAISTLALQALLSAASKNWKEAEAQLVEIGQRSRTEFDGLLHSWPHQLIPGADTRGAIWDCLRNRSTDCPLATQPAAQNSTSAQVLYAEGRWETLLALPSPATDNTSYSFWRGVAFAKTGDCLRAIPVLERGLGPGSAIAAARLADCYRAQTLSAADRLASEGKLASLHKIRGNILLSIRLDPARAEDEYEIALSLKPQDPETLEKLADAYFSDGKLGKAKQAAEEARNLNPHRSQLLQLLIRIAMSERDYPVALSFLAQLLEVQPQNAWALAQEATACSQMDRPVDAAKDLKAALDAGYPDLKGSLHALLAAQLRKLGRTEEARRAGETAVQLADAYQQEPQPGPDDQP